MATIAERVHAARTGSKRTLAEVARAAGVDAAHLYRFEQGERAMSSDRVDRVLGVLGLAVLPGEHSDPPDSDRLLEEATTVPI